MSTAEQRLTRPRGVQLVAVGGDGVGPELMEPTVELLSEHFGLEFVEVQAGFDHFCRTGSSLADSAGSALASCNGVLFGATASPSGSVQGYVSPILWLRRELELFANIRPVKTYLPGRQAVDICIIRENIEGLYAREEMREEGRAVAHSVVTARRTARLARYAYQYALGEGRRRVTVVHKANVLKISDGLFREICLDTAREFPDLEVGEHLVDSAAYWLVRDPGRFDVILTMNLYGDILSDVAAGAADGLGFAPSLSIGPGIPLAEPVHGAAPDVTGKGLANPYGLLFSAGMLLKSLGMAHEAGILVQALIGAIANGVLTPDAGGDCTSAQVFEAVANDLRMRGIARKVAC